MLSPKKTTSKCWWGCGKKENLIPCWWVCKLVEPLLKTVRKFLKLKIELPHDPAISLLGIHAKKMKNTNSKRYMHPNVHQLSSVHSLSSVQSLSRVQLFATPWIAAHQASLSITNSQSSLNLTSIKSVMPLSHFICRPFLLLPPIPPSIRVFSNESTLHMRWPKSHHFMANIWENSGNCVRLYFSGLQNHCRWWLQPWN